MSTETANLIVASASLVVMVVTFFFTFKMYVYMKKSDKKKSEEEKTIRIKEIQKQINVKESQLDKLNKYTIFPIEHTAVDEIRTKKLMLESEIRELYNQL